MAGDTQIFIQEAGPASGPPILLIHGTGAWSEIWRETMTALAASGFHAIAMDVPPFGFSGKPRGPEKYSPREQARRVAGLLAALHIARATVVAHSVGARPGLEFALEHPSAVDKLILVDPALGFSANSATPHFEQPQPSLFKRELFNIEPLRNSLIATVGTNPLFTRRLFLSFVARKDCVTETKVQMLQRPLAMAGTTKGYADWLQYLLASRDTSMVSDFGAFKNVSVPVLIVWGASDNITPLWQGRELSHLIPGSELEVIDRVGHIPYLENPEGFNRILLAFLTQTSQSAYDRSYGRAAEASAAHL